MDRTFLGPDPFITSFSIFCVEHSVGIKLYSEDEEGREIDIFIMSKEQALKLAELIQKKYASQNK